MNEPLQEPTEASSRLSASRRRPRPRVLLGLVIALCLGGCWDDGPIPFEEPLEIIFGSSEINGGRIATDFDFGIPAPVAFNTEIGGFAIYSGTDPGVVSLGPRSLSGVPFGLPDGTPIGMRITEIDPEVQIIFGSGSLLEEGDAVEIGETPIHTHPTWQLSFPPGVEPSPRFVSFVLTTTAPEYQESEEYTMTIVVAEEEEEE